MFPLQLLPLHSLHPSQPFTSKMNNSATLQQRCVASLKTLTPHITCLAVHRNLLYAASLNLINVFDLSHYSHIDAFNQSPASGFVKSIAFTNSRVFTAHQDRNIRVWLITPSKRHRLLSSLPTVTDRLRRCIVPRNYVSVRRHKSRLWIQHCDTVSGLAVNQRLMYSVSWDKSFKVWDLFSFRCLESVKAHEDAINALVVNRDGIVYTASADGSIKVWRRDCEGKRHVLVSSIGRQKSTVNALALDGGGAGLFSGGCDGEICRWEWGCEENGAVKMETLRGHSGAILCLIHVAGLLASASADLTVRIWQRERGRSGYSCRAVLEGHEKPVKSLVAFAGGDDDSNGVVSLFSGSLDGEIKVWELFGSA
ncbi:Protein JINGUBANG-like protein [Vigna angularis]|uniref:Protein JINGUBANG-like protein n=2 Tax=Phaseolus angularis TaxID=3914 RepID=A0A8T0L8B8_PHAAN|nr:Protein JINGUBANG-like protein [Vigna angularis]